LRATLSDQDLVDVRDPSMADRFGKDCFLDLLLVSPFSSAFADAGFDFFFHKRSKNGGMRVVRPSSHFRLCAIAPHERPLSYSSK
jgi:hypothetical protein